MLEAEVGAFGRYGDGCGAGEVGRGGEVVGRLPLGIRPDGALIYVTLDNLSAHTNWRMKRWVAKNKVELLLGQPHRGPLRTAAAVHPGQLEPSQPHGPNPALHAYLRWRSQNARHTDILVAKRRERARSRSEKGVRWGASHHDDGLNDYTCS